MRFADLAKSALPTINKGVLLRKCCNTRGLQHFLFQLWITPLNEILTQSNSSTNKNSTNK